MKKLLLSLAAVISLLSSGSIFANKPTPVIFSGCQSEQHGCVLMHMTKGKKTDDATWNRYLSGSNTFSEDFWLSEGSVVSQELTDSEGRVLSRTVFNWGSNPATIKKMSFEVK